MKKLVNKYHLFISLSSPLFIICFSYSVILFSVIHFSLYSSLYSFSDFSISVICLYLYHLFPLICYLPDPSDICLSLLVSSPLLTSPSLSSPLFSLPLPSPSFPPSLFFPLPSSFPPLSYACPPHFLSLSLSLSLISIISLSSGTTCAPHMFFPTCKGGFYSCEIYQSTGMGPEEACQCKSCGCSLPHRTGTVVASRALASDLFLFIHPCPESQSSLLA